MGRSPSYISNQKKRYTLVHWILSCGFRATRQEARDGTPTVKETYLHCELRSEVHSTRVFTPL